MKLLFSIIISISSLLIQDLPDIREDYFLASKSKENTEKFYLLMSKCEKETGVFQAYKGAAIALKSRYATDAKTKKKLFIEGVKGVELALKNNPNNAEIRLIRLSIQEHTPKILKYKAQINEDKKILLDSFEQQTPALKAYIKKYAHQSKVFSEQEKQALK
ncbi:hypothetical protein [Flavobacterium sp. GT3R68]|uniref:hypothetical protein n=1 Tax=Flavobacterium sp. GT3R68 TaxID=2594437 RepID=UPI000F865F1C|nr:hypothetical protein [Flavobacterium sp. GT3R68]RTY93938.1 hypothetical protein EKL32_13725 [Flavobacterium sp. GSN2]TRW93448.1 hypothetical protein FNW07_00660 [Flavobacterium sp. GT3R68]